MNYSVCGIKEKIDNTLDIGSWYAFEVATTCCFIVGMYIFIALVRHELINGKFKGPYLKPAFMMKVTVMLSSFCFTVCTILLQVEALGYFSGKHFPCASLYRAFSMFLMVGLTSTYIFLWLRQYVFYRTSRFEHTNNIAVRAISTLVIILFFLHFAVLIVVFSITPMTTWSKNVGCHFFPLGINWIKFLVFLRVVPVSTTVILFGLFLYPLCRTERNSTSSNDIDGDENLKSDIKRAIRISIYSTAACFLSDLFAMISSGAGRCSEISAFGINVFNILSLLINIVTLIFTYENPGQILFGCCYRSGD